MFKIILTESYKKRSVKFLRKHGNIINQYKKTVKLLTLNPFHNSLRTHKLKGSLSDCYSISINMNYRIIIYLKIIDNQIVLIDIGSHDEVY
jgi:toxin HigB-1